MRKETEEQKEEGHNKRTLPKSGTQCKTKLHSPAKLNRNAIISSMKKRVKEAFSAQSQTSHSNLYSRSKQLSNGIGKNANSTYCCKEEEQETDSYNPSYPPFPLSNILSRRLSNMSNFSSTSSSLDGTSSDDNGIADNEEDSGEASVCTFNPKYESSIYEISKRRKSTGMNKKQVACKANKNALNRHKNKLRTECDVTKSERQNFKTIQKGIENILKSDILLKEELVNNESNKSEQSYTEDDEDSKDSIKTESIKEPPTSSTCSKKKAKALINCFRSFAVKPK